MGFKTFGFGGGRKDDWQADIIFWGPSGQWMSSNRDASGNLYKPLGATQMGLIYVNPEGPGGVPDPLGAARDTREAFDRMAMNDEETVALIAGGHTFGKAHGAAPADKYVGSAPAGCPIENQGFGWGSTYKTGKAGDAITSGLEGAWSRTPVKFSMQYFDNLLGFDWVLTKGPGGANQWTPKNGAADRKTDAVKWKASPVDLIFGSSSELRAIAEVYAADDAKEKFVRDFALAWTKVMNNDRFDIK